MFQLPIILFSLPKSDQGYHAFGELARFVYCLLQKIKKASSLHLVEQWEEYVVSNHSPFPAIDDKEFPAGTRVMVALDKVGSHYLQTESRRDARRFLEQFVNCVLSTVASGSVIGQGFSCFCTAIVVVGDDVAEYQSSVQEQRQLERSSTRSRPDLDDVLSFCSAQAGFRARQHLYKVCIVSNQVIASTPVSRHILLLSFCCFRCSN